MTSYSRIPQLPPSDFVPFAAWIATWSDSVCRIRSHSQPHDKSHAGSGHMESPSSVYMLFHVCRITHNACRLRLPRIWNPSLSQSYNRNCIAVTGWALIFSRIIRAQYWQFERVFHADGQLGQWSCNSSIYWLLRWGMAGRSSIFIREYLTSAVGVNLRRSEVERIGRTHSTSQYWYHGYVSQGVGYIICQLKVNAAYGV